jgi:hypothetical protein
MKNEDATWCSNEKCIIKTKCWRWLGFCEEGEVDPGLVRKYNGGNNCRHYVKRLTLKDIREYGRG